MRANESVTASGDVPQIRPYREGDDPALVALFARSFGRAITEEHWRWKLKGLPAPAENVWLAACNERPVFQYAGIPVRFCLAGQPVNAMVSVDTMTDPDFRRRGLLTKVASRAYEHWRDAGVTFVLGLPNEQWGSRAQALGWQILFPLQWLGCPLNPEAILRRRWGLPLGHNIRPLSMLWRRFLSMRIRPDSQVRVERVERADDAFDAIWEHCKGDFMFSTVRDRLWVDWRFLRCAMRSYEVLVGYRSGRPIGYAALGLPRGNEGHTGHLAELLVAQSDPGARDTLLHEAVRRIESAGAESIATLAVPGTTAFSALRRRGFFPTHAFSVQVVPLQPALPLDLLRNPNLWRLSGADFDVV